MSSIINNPIVRGFYPDPSVCEANGKYYLVCSSMQFFPGVPLFESDDLVNWKQIGHVLTKPTQIDLERVGASGGVFAPTIRYNDGVFYMVTTNSTYNKNFFVKTTDIYGEWSDPIFVDQGGIDPSLFFEDGKTYFMSNGSDEDNNGCIYQCEINPDTGEKLSESIPIWKGNGGRFLESPHLYHIGDYYYIMAAEGGTEYGHMITYARGNSSYGPFVSYSKNPVATNRNLGGHQSIIQGIGHGDLIRYKDGNYYILCLGFRQQGEWMQYHHIGREVFIMPVSFDEDGWFSAGDNGTVREKMLIPSDIVQLKKDYSVTISDMYKHPERLTYVRKPDFNNYEFYEDKIVLKQTGVSINDGISPSFVAVRQSEFNIKLEASFTADTGEAGVSVYMDEGHHYDAFIHTDKFTGERHAGLRLCIGNIKHVVSAKKLDSEFACFEIVSNSYNYQFSLKTETETIYLGEGISKYLASEVSSPFTGVVIGMYAECIEDEPGTAVFTKFDLSQMER